MWQYESYECYIWRWWYSASVEIIYLGWFEFCIPRNKVEGNEAEYSGTEWYSMQVLLGLLVFWWSWPSVGLVGFSVLQALDEVALQSLQNPKGPTSWELTTSHRRLRDENKTICKESTDADSHESFLVSSGSLPDVQGFLRQWNILFEWHNWLIQKSAHFVGLQALVEGEETEGERWPEPANTGLYVKLRN